jgi:hypothetical protein
MFKKGHMRTAPAAARIQVPAISMLEEAHVCMYNMTGKSRLQNAGCVKTQHSAGATRT